MTLSKLKLIHSLNRDQQANKTSGLIFENNDALAALLDIKTYYDITRNVKKLTIIIKPNFRNTNTDEKLNL